MGEPLARLVLLLLHTATRKRTDSLVTPNTLYDSLVRPLFPRRFLGTGVGCVLTVVPECTHNGECSAQRATVIDVVLASPVVATVVSPLAVRGCPRPEFREMFSDIWGGEGGSAISRDLAQCEDA